MNSFLQKYNELIWFGVLAVPFVAAVIMLPSAARSDQGGGVLSVLILALVCAIALAVYVASRPGMKRTGLYLPDFFLAGLLLYALGAGLIYAIDGTAAAHTVLLMAQVALLSACIGLVGGPVLFERRLPNDYTQQNLVHWNTAKGEEALVYWGLAVSGLVCAYFVFTVLQNQAVSALLSDAFTMEEESLLEARKTITTGGEGYFAPGFVKQFRDNLVPILLCAVILIVTRQQLNPGQRTIVWGTVAIVILGMALTGVRANLFLFFVSMFVARMFANRVHGHRKKKVPGQRKSRRFALYILIAVAGYGALTVLLGRTGEEGLIALPVEIVVNLFDRVLVTVPRENIASYGLWSTIGPTFGGQWLADLGGILPGKSEIGLANLLHNYNGGSLDGHSSLGLPADVWVNWGWIGLVIVPMAYGVFVVYFDGLLTNMRSPVAFGIKVVLGLALLSTYGPFGFILYGGMTSVLVYLGLKALRGDDRPTQPMRTTHYEHFRAA